jgi:hypothetical protein
MTILGRWERVDALLISEFAAQLSGVGNNRSLRLHRPPKRRYLRRKIWGSL